MSSSIWQQPNFFPSLLCGRAAGNTTTPIHCVGFDKHLPLPVGDTDHQQSKHKISPHNDIRPAVSIRHTDSNISRSNSQPQQLLHPLTREPISSNTPFEQHSRRLTYTRSNTYSRQYQLRAIPTITIASSRCTVSCICHHWHPFSWLLCCTFCLLCSR